MGDTLVFMQDGMNLDHASDPTTALSRLKRPHTQRGNSDTRLLLEAGLELLNEALDKASSAGKLATFRWPSRKQVVKRFNRHTGLQMSKAVFDDKWASAGDFATDLIAWALHRSQWSTHRTVAASAMAEIAAVGLAAGARKLATNDMAILVGAPSFRIKLLICALSSDGSSLREPIEDFYRAAIDWWGTVYRQIFRAGNRCLRPDVDLPTFAILMTAMEEGLALRLRAAPELFDEGIDSAASMLALGALGLFIGMTADPSDSATLATCADRWFGGGNSVDRLGDPRDRDGIAGH